MPWKRMMHNGVKVYAEVDEAGKPLARNGLVAIKYKESDPRTYSAKAGRVEEIDERKLVGRGAPRAGTKLPEARLPGGGETVAAPLSADARKGVREPAAVVIHADGACRGNPGPAGAGAVLRYGGKVRERSVFLGDNLTNNIAELSAVREALQAVKKRELAIELHLDSTYVIGLLSQGWRARENKELVTALRELVRLFPRLTFHKVEGHAGIEDNERADALARRALETRASTSELKDA